MSMCLCVCACVTLPSEQVPSDLHVPTRPKLAACAYSGPDLLAASFI
jgi:hypothetical protein